MVVIKDRQSAKRPALPYGVVDLANVRDVHEHVRDELFETSDTPNSEGKLEVIATPEVEQEWTFLVQFYGAGCFDALRRVAAAAHLSQMNESLMPRLVIHEVGTINTIPEFIGQRWEDRAQVNLTLRGTSSDGFVVDVIEDYTIAITGERA